MFYLDLIVHPGTLALGINAPAKTSVFCGDSPFLTALMVCRMTNAISGYAK